MKKWIQLLIVFSIVIGITSCENKAQEESLQEIMDNAIKASEDLKSFHISMDIDQNLTQNEGETTETNMIMEMDLVSDPIAIYEELEIESMPYRMELYLTEEGSYTKDSTTNTWKKLPQELYSSTVEMTKQQSDATVTLEKFKEYMDELKIEEKEDHYVLSFKGSGEEYKQLILDNLKSTMPQGISTEELLEMITINSINYVLNIEKETYYTREFHIETDINIEEDENKTQIVQNIDSTYSKFNEVEAIVVPEEVKEQAEEINQ